MAGKLVVISGPSGVGKSSIAREVLAQCDAQFSVSATTRTPRAGERNKQDYRFVDRREFQRMIDAGELLEWANVFGEMYGTPAEPVLEAMRQGRCVLMDIDVQGGRQVYRKLPNATFILIVPPNDEVLARRLRGRNSEAKEQFEQRLAKAKAEIEDAQRTGAYKHVVVNDDLETAVRRVVEIITEP